VTSAPTLAAALESALNLYLQQVPDVQQPAAALQGKVIALSITGTSLILYFLPVADGVQVLSHYEGDIDTHLSASPLGFARLALGRREDALFQGAVRIEGDIEIGQQFQELFAGAHWDWEEQLSHVTGDIIAHQAGTLGRQAQRFLDDGRATLAQDCSEYLQEEARLLPTRIEVEYFLSDVDAVRDDVSRLAARVERLLQLADKTS
jgi:ubiquinone biosynthesis protein UbiJ